MDEPSWVLRGVTYHFAGGQAWWVGLALILFAIRSSFRPMATDPVSRPRQPTVFFARVLPALLGFIWLALSGWPSYVLQTLLVVGLVVWLIRPTRPLALGLRAIVVVSILAELPWFIGPRVVMAPVNELAVIGDSVTAGLNARDITWPQVLAQSGVCTIWDASQQGATVQSAVQQLSRLDSRGDALLIEIGGNDLLEGLPVEVFAERLDELLRTSKLRYLSVTMLELPLPPFSNRYGIVQRQLAGRHGVSLIPKREFARVLTTSGSTVDGIHLSDRGQQQMAEVIRYWLRLPVKSAVPVEYYRVDVR